MAKNYFVPATFNFGVLQAEISTPATPAAGFVALYAKSDHKIYIKDSTGVETDITTAAGGGGQASIQFQDEGSNVGSNGAITAINFVGPGYTASVASTTLTLD